MFEFDEIMRQRESKQFAGILHRLRKEITPQRILQNSKKDVFQETLPITQFMFLICSYKIKRLISLTVEFIGKQLVISIPSKQ